MGNYKNLFSPLKGKNLELKNRISMAPFYLGMAKHGGEACDVLIDHYAEMGSSGAGLVVVENAAVDIEGMGSPTTLRADSDEYLPGLKQVAQAIKKGGAEAFLQINHTGKYAYQKDKWGPSEIKMGEATVREMSRDVIDRTVAAYANAAKIVKEAGFDGVEIHGGTGYLLVQFLGARYNQRTDEFGGSLENRMRFPLMVADAVCEAVGPDYPVGYRFLADEWLDDGLHLEETTQYARELDKHGLTYLSVMAGTYDAFFQQDYLKAEKEDGYMVKFAAGIKKSVENAFIITAGRIQSPEFADEIIATGKADMVGLARVLLADPLWPKKAAGEVNEPIAICEPTCQFCMMRTFSGKPGYCVRWPKPRRNAFKLKIGEKIKNSEKPG